VQRLAPSHWIIPSYTKSIDYVPIRKIDFTSASGNYISDIIIIPDDVYVTEIGIIETILIL